MTIHRCMGFLLYPDYVVLGQYAAGRFPVASRQIKILNMANAEETSLFTISCFCDLDSERFEWEGILQLGHVQILVPLVPLT